MPKKPKRPDRVHLYGSPGAWRWRVTAPNGRIIGASTEAYVDRDKAVANCERVTGRTPTPAL